MLHYVVILHALWLSVHNMVTYIYKLCTISSIFYRYSKFKFNVVFYRASSLICGNKMPTRCNRWFLLQILLFAQHVSGTIMPIIRSSRVLYRWLLPVVFGAWFSSCRYGVELKVMCPVWGLQPANRTHNLPLHTIPTTWKPSTKYHRQQPSV